MIRRHKRLANLFLHDLSGVLALEWNLASDHVIERRAKSVNIRGWTNIRLAFGLFGTDVIRSSKRFSSFCFRGLAIAERAGKTKIRQLHNFRLVDHYIFGFDIAVDKSLLMRVLERLRNLHDNLN